MQENVLDHEDLNYDISLFKHAYLAQLPEANKFYMLLSGERGLEQSPISMTFGSDVNLLIQTALLLRNKNAQIAKLLEQSNLLSPQISTQSSLSISKELPQLKRKNTKINQNHPIKLFLIIMKRVNRKLKEQNQKKKK